MSDTAINSERDDLAGDSYALAGNSYDLAGPGDYFALLKPRVMSLVIFTAFVGMVGGVGVVRSLGS